MTTRGADRVKLAIQSEPPLPNKYPLLYDFEIKLDLPAIMRDVCGRWNVDNPEKYAFKYADPPPGQPGKFGYISETNRHELKDGDILRVALSPDIAAQEYFTSIRQAGDYRIRHNAMVEIYRLSKDQTFAMKFISLNGMDALVSMIQTENHLTDQDSSQMANMLGAFQELMEHSLVSWSTLTQNFVNKLILMIEKSRPLEIGRSPIVSKCLSILESILLSSSDLSESVMSGIELDNIIRFLESPSQEVQQYALALINTMLLKSPDKHSFFRKLQDKRYGKLIQQHIYSKYINKAVPREIAHELYAYQTHSLNLVEKTMRLQFDRNNPTHEDAIKMLPKRAFPDDYLDGRPRSPTFAEQHWKMLGFVNSDPRVDFNEVPPGILALNCMIHFAKTKHDAFTHLLFTPSDNQCPFARASISLTKILCSIFKIGEPPSDLAYNFLPMLLWSDHPLEEVFCYTIQLLFKTWREMRATEQDYEKVMVVVQKQIVTIVQQGSNLANFELFKTKLFELSYKKIISESEEKTQLLDDSVWNSKPVRELRDKLKPEIEDLVKQQRLKQLVEGALFPKLSVVKKSKRSYFYCRLSPNHKVLHFGDCEENAKPALDALDSKIPVSDIRLEVGRDCPHVKDSKTKGAKGQILPEMGFSVYYEGGEHLDFVTPNESVYAVWTDGLSVLCKNQLPSKAALEEMDTLLHMDLKLRLLDVESITIPDQPPPIPPNPPNYDFAYKLD